MSGDRLNAALIKIKENPVYQYGLLTAIMLLAAVLRFYKLGEWSLWRDELATINRALGHFNLETIIEQWWRPPLSVIFTGGLLQSFGISEWSARLASVLIGIISIPVIFFVTKNLFDLWVGFTASILLAVSPWHINWSQNARFYTSLMLLYFLSSIAIYLFLVRGRTKYLVFFGILFFFAISERLIAFLLVPVVLIYLLSLWIFPFEKTAEFKVRKLALLAVPAIAFIGLELYSLITAGITRLGFTLETFSSRPIDDPIRIFILIIYDIGFPLAGLALLSAIYFIVEKSRLGLFFVINAFLPPLLLAVISQTSFIVDRYAFVSLPSWIILVSYGIVEIYRKLSYKVFYVSIAVLFLLVADAFGANLMYYQINHGNRPEWKQAFEFVTERAVEGDVIVSSVSELASYYTKKDVVWLGDIKPEDIKSNGNRYWFVIDSENGWFAAKQKNWVEGNADLIDVLYLRVRENINIKIYLYNQEYINPAR